VTPPKPSPNIILENSAIEGVSIILSASGPSRTSSVLSSFKSKWYILPLWTSATNKSFIYCVPNLSETRNLAAVGPSVSNHTSSGSLYFPFPSN
jgi:hypothetical protein